MSEKQKTQWGKWQGRNPEKNRKRMWVFLILAIFFLFMGLFGKDLLPKPDEADTVQDSSAVPAATETVAADDAVDAPYEVYTFANEDRLEEHYEKHGVDMGFDSAEDYEAAANDVIHDDDALHKTEEEDGDDIYYLEDDNYIVFVSEYGNIRTFFEPDDGIAYYYRQ
ncbi:MAG: hypothetical protein ACOX8R_07245 [Bacillota bacterium]|jgi:pyocin large subunit-like protein